MPDTALETITYDLWARRDLGSLEGSSHVLIRDNVHAAMMATPYLLTQLLDFAQRRYPANGTRGLVLDVLDPYDVQHFANGDTDRWLLAATILHGVTREETMIFRATGAMVGGLLIERTAPGVYEFSVHT